MKNPINSKLFRIGTVIDFQSRTTCIVRLSYRFVACSIATLAIFLTIGCEDPGRPDLTGVHPEKRAAPGDVNGTGSAQVIPQASPIPEADRVK